ncbi:MAG TPA: HAMP domain-containing sensor histidine kinase [Chloroflexota bacterium]|nr:HAMP domain-containing sensor histidine kinase [Chloroflexota bacterium]
MRTLRIRKWMIVGMLIFLALTGLFYHITDVLERQVLQPVVQQQAQQQDAAVDAVLRDIARSPARWHDPGWQRSVRDKLAELGVGAVILAPSGAAIFRAGHIGSWMQSSRQAVVLEGGRQLGTVELFVPVRTNPLAPASAALALVLALLFVGWQIGRGVVRPLEALSRAARQIAQGHLDFALPASQVTEVAQVRAAFEVMRDGLKESIEQQAALEEERRLFIGAIAHDLRTPLFTLRAHLRGLQKGIAATPEKVAEYVDECSAQANALERLVADLFAFTRLEYLEQEPERAPLELGVLLRQTAEGAQPLAAARGITLALEAPAQPCPLLGDGHLLARAVANLLDNALRHTPEGGQIRVRWHWEDATLVFTVADTGPGIAAHDLPHLFTPLYRGDASRNRQTGGAGLGLTIARRILQAHGGDLGAANSPAGGAVFTGTLPAARPAPPPANLATATGA